MLQILRARGGGANLYQKELNKLLTLSSQLRCFSFMHDHPQSKNYRLPQRCIRLMKYECFQPGQTIFRAGDEPDRFYLILKGSVNVFNSKPRHIIEKEKKWLSFLDSQTKRPKSAHKSPAKELRFDIAAKLHFEFQDQKAQEIQEQTTTYAKQKTGKNLFKVDLDDDTSVESLSLDPQLTTEKFDSESAADPANSSDDDSSSDSGSSCSESSKEATVRPSQRESAMIEAASMFNKMLGGIELKNIHDIKQYFEEDIFTLLYERTLTVGTLLGELGLLSRRPRARTLICKDFCEMVSFGREGYYDLMTLISERKVSDNLELVRKSLFPGLTLKSHLSLLGIMKLGKYSKGDYIYKVGDPGDKVYLIKEGEVMVKLYCHDHCRVLLSFFLLV